MTDKELVERLNAYSAQYQNHGGITAEAADRIEQLHTELTKEKIDNTNLIGELSTVAAERDRYKAKMDAIMDAVRGDCNYCNYQREPLTLEELRRMDGEVVYIPESEEYFGGMGIVSVSQERIVDAGGPKFGFWPFRNYGQGWIAYRSKPKRSE